MNDRPRYATAQDYLRVVREQRLLIVLTTILVAGASFAYAARQDPSYEAVSRLVLRDDGQALLGGSADPRLTPQIAATYTSRITSPEVTDDARRRLPPGLALGGIQASVEQSTNFVAIRATADTGARAAATANAYADAIVERITSETRDRLRESAREIGRQLRQIPEERRGSFNYADLQQRQFQFRSASRLAQPLVVLDRASAPASPVSPRPVRNTVLGAFFGLAMGLLLAFLRDTIDVRLRRSTDVEGLLDLPLIGRLSPSAFGTTGLEEDAKEGSNQDAEASAMLRKNVEFLDVRNPPKTVLVTSANAGDGKSTVAARLAVASAAAGRRTLLLECDLRRPVVADRLGLRRGPGLAEYLQGQAQPSELLQVVELPAALPDADPRRLVCVTAGDASGRVSELLGSPTLGRLLDEVSEVYDLVVLDTGPLLAVADPLELAPICDAVLLVVRMGETRRAEASAARAALGRVPPRPTAVVATGVDSTRDRDYLPYAYYAPASVERASG